MTEFFVIASLFIVVAFLLGLFLGNKAGKGTRKTDGYLNVVKGDARLVYQLEIVTQPEKLQTQDCIVLCVRNVAPTSEIGDVDILP